MVKDCSTCKHSVLTVRQEPCVSCLDLLGPIGLHKWEPADDAAVDVAIWEAEADDETPALDGLETRL